VASYVTIQYNTGSKLQVAAGHDHGAVHVFGRCSPRFTVERICYKNNGFEQYKGSMLQHVTYSKQDLDRQNYNKYIAQMTACPRKQDEATD
jgi:hypothetical protein